MASERQTFPNVFEPVIACAGPVLLPPSNRTFQPALVILALLAAGCTSPEVPRDTTDPPTAPTTDGGSPTPPTRAPDAGARPPGVPGAGNLNLSFARSQNGLLQVKLDLVNATVAVNGTSYSTAVYNGRLVNPVWVLQPGDVLQVFLQDHRVFANGSANGTLNGTAPVDPHADHGSEADGTEAGPVYTNIHFHGLNVPPTPPGDNVFIAVNPNGSAFRPWDYRYSLLIPEDHPQGLFWWHAHPHGLSNDQVRGGMSGAMIIGDVLGTHYPEFASAEEQVFLLRDFSNVPMTSGQGGGPVQKAIPTINGQTQGEVDLAPGELQFWRFANIGGNVDFEVVLENETQDRVPFFVVAVDGNVLDQPQERDELLLYPGARLEALVVGPPAGNYTLRSVDVAERNEEPRVDLATVVSSGPAGNASEGALRNATNARPDARFLALRQWAEDGNKTVPRTFTFRGHGNGTGTINGLEYDPDRNDTVVNFGDIETWTIANANQGGPHVFHIHQLDFLVTHVNGTKVDMHGLQDTAFVPMNGTVTLLIPFTEPQTIGRFVYHCHYLPHEDNGMMANIVVRTPPEGTVVV